MKQSSKRIIYFFLKYLKTSCPRTRKQQNNCLRVLKGTNTIKEMRNLEGGVRTKGKRGYNKNFGAVPKPSEISDYDYIS